MICPHCSNMGHIDVMMVLETGPGEADPRTGDVPMVKYWQCIEQDHHREPYNGEDKDDDEHFDSLRDQGIL